jgi:hypothetical protein
MRVVIDGLPTVFRRMVHRVVDAEVRMGLCDAVPPRPGFFVERTMSVVMEALNSPEIRRGHDCVCGSASVGFNPGRVAQVCSRANALALTVENRTKERTGLGKPAGHTNIRIRLRCPRVDFAFSSCSPRPADTPSRISQIG